MTYEATSDATREGSVTANWSEHQLAGRPVVLIDVRKVRPARSPRAGGENEAHIRILAESVGHLPPIIVHSPTMRVIDGMHRLRAAILRGQTTIAARLFDGSDSDAFVLAVQSNVAHGLPLSLADRTSAARRIVRSHPQWSDRMIAAVAGVAPGTVRNIRTRLSQPADLPDARVGRDGRVRPINGAAGRQIASQLMRDDPTASLRDIARAAGVSASTAHDVRRRLMAGLDPVRPTQRTATTEGKAEEVRPSSAPAVQAGLTAVPAQRRSVVVADSRAGVLQALHRDPSLRYTDSGRILLRWLTSEISDRTERNRVLDAVPEHLVGRVIALAEIESEAWQAAVDRLRQRRPAVASG